MNEQILEITRQKTNEIIDLKTQLSIVEKEQAQLTISEKALLTRLHNYLTYGKKDATSYGCAPCVRSAYGVLKMLHKNQSN